MEVLTPSVSATVASVLVRFELRELPIWRKGLARHTMLYRCKREAPEQSAGTWVAVAETMTRS